MAAREVTNSEQTLARVEMDRPTAADVGPPGNIPLVFGVIVSVQIPRRFTTIPGFGLLFCVVALPTTVVMAIIYGAAWGLYPHSKGVEVRITKPVTPVSSRHEEPVAVLVLRSRGGNQDPDLFVNSKAVERDALPATLRSELSRRAERVVYVEADEELPFADVMHAVGAAQEAWDGATVVLLTPKLKTVVFRKWSCTQHRGRTLP